MCAFGRGAPFPFVRVTLIWVGRVANPFRSRTGNPPYPPCQKHSFCARPTIPTARLGGSFPAWTSPNKAGQPLQSALGSLPATYLGRPQTPQDGPRQQDKTSRCWTRQDETRQDEARPDKTRQDSIQVGPKWPLVAPRRPSVAMLNQDLPCGLDLQRDKTCSLHLQSH